MKEEHDLQSRGKKAIDRDHEMTHLVSLDKDVKEIIMTTFKDVK